MTKGLVMLSGVKNSSSTNVAGLAKCKRKKHMKLDPYLILYTKVHSKWITKFDSKSVSIKYIEQDIGRILSVLPQTFSTIHSHWQRKPKQK